MIETNTFGANRPKLAANYLEDELHAINSSCRQARARGAGDLGPRRLHRRLDRAARRGRAAASRLTSARSSSPSRLRCSKAEASTSSPFETFSRAGRARGCDRRGPGGVTLASRSSRCSPSTRRRRRSPASRPREAADRLRGLDVAAVGANHGAGLLAASWPRSSEMRRRRPAARRAAQHRARQPVGRPRSSIRMPLPSTSPSSPRTRATRLGGHRRLLRHDSDRDRRHRLGGDGGAASRAHRSSSAERESWSSSPGRSREENRARPRPPREGVGRSPASSTHRSALATPGSSRSPTP